MPEYGRKGSIGIATPQANPTVEPELRLLLPAGVGMHSTRLVSSGEPQQRFIDYIEQLPAALASFDTLALNVLGFACTASSYLLPRGREQKLLKDLQSAGGVPVCTAAEAIHAALKVLGARRIALACPYPAWLLSHALDYWSDAGYEILRADSLQPNASDTRSIYQLDSSTAIPFLSARWRKVEADVLVITGTGMPGLRSIVALQALTGKPVLTSNLCLAWHCLQRAGISPGERAPDQQFPLLSGWQEDLARL